MTTSDPTGMHDWHDGAYVQDWIDAQRDDERDSYIRRMVHRIGRNPDDEVRVLDIGGGYGAVTQVVLDVFPRARVVLHDFSDPMLKAAAERLANFSDSVSYYRGDLMSPDWAAGLANEGFDAVVSSIAIHNVRFPDRIRGIYSEIFPLVAPGGAFLNFDQVASPGTLASRAERQGQLLDRRRRVFQETGRWEPIESIQAGRRNRGGGHEHGTSPEDQQRLDSHEASTLTNQLRWLLEAGFSEAECFYHDGRRALMGAFKAG